MPQISMTELKALNGLDREACALVKNGERFVRPGVPRVRR